ncbi:hypothetical protein GCM10009854_49770 [Saccharopolyspora halophila]|uniref:DUF427 domain-containing protein n=1 Tax=Saccharopolyspora halophila TaxID=405551 RepID=A0ABN3GY96_9PSEU
MLRAVQHGTVLAGAPRTVRVEENDRCRPDSVHQYHSVRSVTGTLRPRKGIARYYQLVIDDAELLDAAWCCPHPSPFARRIRGHIPFEPAAEFEGEPGGPGGGLFGRLRSLVGGAR